VSPTASAWAFVGALSHTSPDPGWPPLPVWPEPVEPEPLPPFSKHGWVVLHGGVPVWPVPPGGVVAHGYLVDRRLAAVRVRRPRKRQRANEYP